MYICMCIYIYIHACVCIYIYIYIMAFGVREAAGPQKPRKLRVEGLGLIRTVAGEYQRLLSTQPFTLNPKP